MIIIMMMNKYLHKTDFLITNWDTLSGFEKSEELRKVVFCKSYNKITKKRFTISFMRDNKSYRSR